MPVTPITSIAHWNAAVEENTKQIIVVDFTAPAWCAPCRKIAPYVKTIADTPTVVECGFEFFEVDVDHLPDLMKKYQVTALPTFLIFYKGVVKHKIEGASRSKLKDAINTYYRLPYLEEDAQKARSWSQ